MILLIDLCYRAGSLSRDEFVGPIERLLREAKSSVSPATTPPSAHRRSRPRMG
jgi:hypothetical protein